MKKMLKFSVLSLLLISLSCAQHEDALWEISPESGVPVIEQTVDDIQFKFCLLNEFGEPSTVFNEGANFSIYFAVTNNWKEEIYIYPGYAFSDEFCEVYRSDDLQNLGKPFALKGVGIGGFPFAVGKSYIFEQPWLDERETTWNWEHGLFESTHQVPLPKGNYYTEVKHQFEYALPNVEGKRYTDTLFFKINFKIL